MADVTKHLMIKGRVQGVGFRYAMCDEAIRKKVTGWVKNNSDGSVEAAVQGSEAAAHFMIEWVKQGPLGARIEEVQVSDGVGNFSDFEIRY